jgi:predicted ATPase
VRLVTLLGPPGIGKTRLGVQVAADLRDAFAAGVWFVPLAPLQEAPLVIPAIARVFDVHEIAGQPVIDTLVRALQGQQLLLVLDNFEQVVARGAGPRAGAGVRARPHTPCDQPGRVARHG